MTGSITGSANANVATTGSFTIPMMIKAKFRPEFSAGVETAASTGGQIMPPIMGASAFLIVEFTGISYWEIVKVSILPAALELTRVGTPVLVEVVIDYSESTYFTKGAVKNVFSRLPWGDRVAAIIRR